MMALKDHRTPRTAGTLKEGLAVETQAPETPVTQRQSQYWRDAGLITLLMLIAVSHRGWLLYHTEVLARDSIGFIRYALEFETDSWPAVLRNNHQHPGYPLSILAVSVPVRALTTSPDADAMMLSAQLASSIAGILLVIPMYFLGKLVFHRAAGFGAAALFQCLPVPAHILSDGLSEALFLLLASTALAVAVLAMRGSKPWLFALSGGFCGLAYLTRPEGALVPVAVVLVLVGLRLAKIQMRSARELAACGLGIVGVAALVGSPYVYATHRLTNKPSVSHMLGRPMPQLNGAPVPPPPQALLGDGPGGPLLASTFGITLNLQDAYVRRVFQALWGLGGELAKCFHYVAWVPVLLGMWWFRRRVLLVPGMWVLLVLCGLSTLGLLRLAVFVGYMSDRHLMLLVMCGCYGAAAAVWELPGRCIAWRRAKRESESETPRQEEEQYAPGLGVSVLSVALLVCLIATGLPKSLERLHANRAGYHAAGLWLAQHAEPSDGIHDDHCWADYFAGRVMQERHPPLPPTGYRPAHFYVIGRRDREINAVLWNIQPPPSEENLQAHGGFIVYHWPVQCDTADASVVVYKVPPTAPGGQN